MNKSFEMLWIPTSVSSGKKLQVHVGSIAQCVTSPEQCLDRAGVMAGESGVCLTGQLVSGHLGIEIPSTKGNTFWPPGHH